MMAIVIFALSIVAAAGVFGYTAYLQNAITSADTSLTRARAAYDPAVIDDILRLNARIINGTTLLQNHLAPSEIFTLLENTTLPSVRFNTFEYAMNQNGVASISLAGEALDFSSVALQSDAFGASKSLHDIMFSDVTTDPATGHVIFKVSAVVDPSLVSYRSSVMASGGQPSSAPAGVQTTPVNTAAPVTGQ